MVDMNQLFGDVLASWDEPLVPPRTRAAGSAAVESPTAGLNCCDVLLGLRTRCQI